MSEGIIYKKLADVMRDVKAVPKAGYNQSQRFNFRTVDDTVESVNRAMVKHDVVMIPNVIKTDYDTETSAKGGIITTCRILVAYTFFAEDGSAIEMTIAGEGKDHGDKSTSKALSMALKYALFQSLLIPTGEPDPDGEVVEPVANPNALSKVEKLDIASLGLARGLADQNLLDHLTKVCERTILSSGDLTKDDYPIIKASLT